MSDMLTYAMLMLPDGTGKKIDLPTPPAYEDFRKRKAWAASYTRVEDTDFTPCLSDGCGGRGWVYDPNDPPCPVEGNKMRERITCPVCHGTGKSSRDEFFRAHDKEIQRVMSERAVIERRVRQAQSAMSKLDTYEWDSVKKLFFR